MMNYDCSKYITRPKLTQYEKGSNYWKKVANSSGANQYYS